MVSQRCSVLCVSLLLALGSISWPHHMSGSYLWGLRLFPPSCPAFWVAPFRHLTSRGLPGDIHERSLPSSLRVLQETAPGRYLVSSPVLEAGRQIACNLEVTWVIRNDVCVWWGEELHMQMSTRVTENQLEDGTVGSIPPLGCVPGTASPSWYRPLAALSWCDLLLYQAIRTLLITVTKIHGRNHLKEEGFFKPMVQRVPFIIGGSDRWLEWFGTWWWKPVV